MLEPATQRVGCRIAQVTGVSGVIWQVAIMAIDRTVDFTLISILFFSAWMAIESTIALRRLARP